MKGYNKTQTFKELTAGEISKMAGEELLRRCMYTWRQNNIAVRGRIFTGERGQSDRIGYSLNDACFVACEVKKIGDTLKPDQVTFLTRVHNAGGWTAIATQNKESGKFELNYWKP